MVAPYKHGAIRRPMVLVIELAGLALSTAASVIRIWRAKRV